MIVGESKPPLAELAHHGIKGMHWGVRRQLKREARQGSNAFYDQMRSKIASGYQMREISESEYKSLSSKPIKLGKDFNRITDKNGDFRDFVYASKTKEDAIRYRAILGPGGKRTDKKFEAKIKTSMEAVSPGFKERVDTYIKTLDDPVTLKNGKVVTQREKIFGKNPAARALNSRELGLRTYNSFVQSQVAGEPITTAYFNNLRQKGFTAVVDDADRGFMADLPVIIFPKESGASITELKPVSKTEVLEAKRDVKLLDQ